MNARETAAVISRDLASRLGPRLQSVLLYGSAARDEFLEGRSDINLLVLLDRIDPPVLKQLAPAAAEWLKHRVNVMLLEEREWARASDAFAVELLDMRDARVVLHGTDAVGAVTIDPADARLQAERELRGRLVALHNGMVRSASNPSELGLLLMAAMPSFATYLRTALRLSGRAAPAAMHAVIEDGTRLVGAPAEGFLRALDARSRSGEWLIDLEDEVVEQYGAAAERTAWYVDSLGGNRQ
jgi:predicted nucleotidyltransferase